MAYTLPIVVITKSPMPFIGISLPTIVKDKSMTLPKLTFEILGGVVGWLVAKIWICLL